MYVCVCVCMTVLLAALSFILFCSALLFLLLRVVSYSLLWRLECLFIMMLVIQLFFNVVFVFTVFPLFCAKFAFFCIHLRNVFVFARYPFLIKIFFNHSLLLQLTLGFRLVYFNIRFNYSSNDYWNKNEMKSRKWNENKWRL